MMIAEEILASIVGVDNLSREQATLVEYSRDISFVSSIKPDCVIKVKNVEQIKSIVRLARETQTPLIPVSSGPPHFKGDTVPSIGGVVIVDLSGMKEIIRVDRLNRVAMFEPAVTFGELIPAVAKEGLRLNMPLLPRQSKSVVGSMLEREPVVIPCYHWDISDPLSCIEIIFGNGDAFRTGAAAGPGTIEEQWTAGGAQKEAAGPAHFSLHRVVQGAQGTMGIVTWASARCELIPTLEEPFLIGSSQLDKVLEMVHWLVRLRMVNECLVLNNTNLATIMAQKWPDDYCHIKNSLPNWILLFNIAGYKYLPEKRVSGQIEDIKGIAQRVGVTPVQAIGKVSASELLTTIQCPSKEPYWKLRHKGTSHDIFFLTSYDKVCELIRTMHIMADEVGYPFLDMGIYLQPIVQGINYHCEFTIFYESSEVAMVKSLSAKAIRSLMAKGAFFSRPYGEITDTVMNGNASTVATLHRVKSIFDPDNIMNPGKLCF